MGYSDKEKKREYQKQWLRDRRASFFKGKTCVECKSDNDLQLDHMDPSTKLYSPGALWSMSDTNPKKIAELAKCQVLCTECHKKKTKIDVSAPRIHGTYKMYKTERCRCELCREWSRNEKARYRREKKTA